MTRGTTTQDWSQRISSVVTPKSRKSTSFQSKPRSPCTELASRGRAVPGRPPSCHTSGRCYFKVCGEVSSHERWGNDPTYAREDDSVWKPPATTQRTRCQNCRSKNRPPSGQNCGHRAPNAHRGQRALGGPPSACTWVWFHFQTNMPKCRRANGVSHHSRKFPSRRFPQRPFCISPSPPA